MKLLFALVIAVSVSPAFGQDLRAEGISLPPDAQVLQLWGKAAFPPPEQTIRIVSWNIYKANKAEKWGAAMSELSRNADLVFGQEGWKVPAFLGFVEEPLGFLWGFATSYKHRGYETGIFFGSRVPVGRMTWHRSPGREPILGTPKMAMSALIPLKDGRRLLAMNIHSINFVRLAEFKRQLIPLFEIIKEHQGPVIFAGDFNTWSGGRMKFLMEEMRALKMGGIGFKDDPRRAKVDHVFYRSLGLTDARIRHDVSTSDHWPLTAVFSLKEKTASKGLQEPRP